MARRTWVQFEVKRSPGAEDWVLVRCQGKTFRMSESSEVAELLLGCVEGWSKDARRRAEPPKTLDEWRHWRTTRAGRAVARRL